MKTSNLTKNAVLYCRVSTKEQVDDGNSLTTQKRLCSEYCERSGYNIISSFIEEGESAKTADRTELQNLLKFCLDKKNAVHAVIVYKIDRLSRNTYDYGQIRMTLKARGVEIRSITEPFEDDPVGRFMENTMANIAQLDNDIRAERCANGMKEAVREGRYVWKAPIGYKNIKVNGKSTITKDFMAPIIYKAFEMIASGIYSIEEVRQDAIKNGLTLPNGKNISNQYFHKLIRNKLYMGEIHKFGEIHIGSFDPVVTRDLFLRGAVIIKTKRERYESLQA